MEKPAARRCARPNQIWGPMISALLALSHGTLSCQILTATGSPSRLVLVSVNHRPRTRSRLLRNRSSPLPPKGSTCILERSSPSPSSSLMWFTGPYTCDYLVLLPSRIQFYWFFIGPMHTNFSLKVCIKKCEPYHR